MAALAATSIATSTPATTRIDLLILTGAWIRTPEMRSRRLERIGDRLQRGRLARLLRWQLSLGVAVHLPSDHLSAMLCSWLKTSPVELRTEPPSLQKGPLLLVRVLQFRRIRR